VLKSILLIAALAAAPAFAEPLEAANAKDPAIAQKCKDGCIVLSPQDAAELVSRVNEFANQAFQAGALQGYAAGEAAGLETAKKNPKICPKNT
jgi:flagellar biosynthesis/type III secretory pathway protein FliH